MRIASVAVFLLLAGVLTAGTGLLPHQQRKTPPNVMLWSWFGNDDFRVMNDKDVGVAYLALSLQFEGAADVIPSPRKMPVLIARDTYRMAVIRFDYDSSRAPSFSPKQREEAVQMVEEIATLARPQAVQIDFDAPQSALPFYRQLLSDIRARLEPKVFLSMTALVSWCERSQSWMTGLPVDEIVPMAFYMGRPTAATVTMLERGGQFAFQGCRSSLGVSLSGTWTPGLRRNSIVKAQRGQRAYFSANPQRWSPEVLATARKDLLQ